MSRPNIFAFQLNLGMNECQFWLATVVSSNPFNFVNAQCYEQVSGVKECALIKLIGLLFTTMASRNDIHSALV